MSKKNEEIIPEDSSISFFHDESAIITFPTDKRKFPKSKFDFHILTDGKAYEPDNFRVDDREILEKALREFAELKRKKFRFQVIGNSRQDDIEEINAITVGDKGNHMARIYLKDNGIVVDVDNNDCTHQVIEISLPIDGRTKKKFGLNKEKGE